MLKVALVDDHQLFREGLRALLDFYQDIRVVGEAGDARAAYALVDATRPDVVLLDMLLPGVNGISAAQELVRRAPKSRVLMLSGLVDEAHAAHALTVGALGFALKDQPAAEILQALREVAVGRTYLSPRLQRGIVDEHLQRQQQGVGPKGPLSPLSAREREVFDLLVRGFSNDSISGQLCISVKTVETHRSRVMKKLNVHSITELIRFAARHLLLRD